MSVLENLLLFSAVLIILEDNNTLKKNVFLTLNYQLKMFNSDCNRKSFDLEKSLSTNSNKFAAECD